MPGGQRVAEQHPEIRPQERIMAFEAPHARHGRIGILEKPLQVHDGNRAA